MPLEAYLGLSSAIYNLNMPFAQEKIEERISSQVGSMSKQAQPNTDWLGVMQDKWSMTGECKCQNSSNSVNKIGWQNALSCLKCRNPFFEVVPHIVPNSKSVKQHWNFHLRPEYI